MEKTLAFAINEAIGMGRASAMPSFLETELREKIAQEIIAASFGDDWETNETDNALSIKLAVMIVKGQK